MSAGRRLSRVDFESIRPLLDISEERVNAAYEALVLGQSFQAVAVKFGWSRQAVNGCVNVVMVMHERFEKALKAREKAIGEVDL